MYQVLCDNWIYTYCLVMYITLVCHVWMRPACMGALYERGIAQRVIYSWLARHTRLLLGTHVTRRRVPCDDVIKHGPVVWLLKAAAHGRAAFAPRERARNKSLRNAQSIVMTIDWLLFNIKSIVLPTCRCCCCRCVYVYASVCCQARFDVKSVCSVFC